jgi:hypothetical protein
MIDETGWRVRNGAGREPVGDEGGFIGQIGTSVSHVRC